MTPSRFSPKQVALLTWISGLALSALLAWWVHGHNRHLYAQRLHAVTDEMAALVTQRFSTYEYGLRGARGAVVAGGGAEVRRSAFAAYMQTRDMAREFPGALGFGLIRRVPRADEARFLARARDDGAPEFSIRELQPHVGERFVIEYIYPIEANRAAMGLDVASEVNRQVAAMTSAREGRAQITAPITLVQAGQSRRGFLAFLPVYRVGAASRTSQAREAATFGWAYTPLVVDDVLAGLGDRLQEVSIRLTDGSEQEPFYDSLPKSGGHAQVDVPETSREITVLGRKWVLHARALPALTVAARPTSLVGVATGAALFSSLLALLVWVALHSRRRTVENGDAPAGVPAVGVRHFLRSPILGWGLSAYGIFLALFLVFGHDAERDRQVGEARRILSAAVDDRAARLKAAQESRRKTMLFLADVPPIQGLIRAMPSGVDPQDGSNRATWELRMQQILTAHLNASPEVYQARLIGVANGGRELVRVERRGHEVVAAPASQLQPNGDTTYFKQTLALPAGEVWVSELDLNRVNGQVEQPHRPTIRYGTPVYQPDGKAFGILVVNVDVAARLADSAAAVAPGATMYITNAAGDFLAHPDPTRRFGFDLGRSHRWDDEFQPDAVPVSSAQDRLTAWRSTHGQFVAASATVTPNASSTVGTLRYTVTLPMQQIEAAVWPALGKSLVMPLAAGLAGLFLMYFYWVGVQRQLQVKSQRLQLAAIVDQSMDAIVGLDAELRITSWNRGAEQLFGQTEAQAARQPLLDLIGAPPDLGEAFDTGDGAETWKTREFDCRSRDGRILRMAMNWSRLGGGVPGASSAILRDVTEERASQQRIVDLNLGLEKQVQERTASLAHERQRLDNILRGTDVGTWEWNVATGAMHLNERWADIVGYRLDELMPVGTETWDALVHPDDMTRSRALLRAHFEGRLEHFSVEIRMRHKSGHWVWVLARGRLTSRTQLEKPEWMFGTNQDITAIKEAELEVKRVAALLASVLKSATELSIIATDPEGLITLFNTGAEQMLGYRADELVGLSTPALLHLQDEVIERGRELSAEFGCEVAGFRVFVHKAEIDGAERRKWTYVRKDGTELPVTLIVTPIRDDTGVISGYLGIAQDITERLQYESALRESKAVAEAANAAKSMFLANMSHEIRTPMNAVIGVAHLLESTTLDGDQRLLLSKLQIAGRSLLGIINDVLDVSKIEAGEMSIDLAPMDPVRLLRELEQLFSPQAQAKGLTLELQGLDALPPSLMADELRIRQILTNLFSNALKFTQQGGVTLAVQHERDDQGLPWLRWSVRDTGIGIRPEAMGTLFHPFIQADSSTTRRFGGTGLGLSIVRKLADLMGGEVGVRSEPGVGSEFWLKLPLVEADEGGSEPHQPVSVGLDVVVVDDVDDDRRVLVGMCRALGWRALDLPSGEALAEHCLRIVAEGRDPPDALLVDWQMPGLDGLTALERVAQIMGKKHLPAALIISAHERDEIAALDHNHLADHILTKPIGPSELFNAVNHSVSLHTGSTERVARSTRISAIDARWLSGVQVLIVDDSDINLEVARRLLTREGAVVSTAVNGLDALAQLKQAPTRFDAVLMDVQMPELDGYEATRRIRGELGLTALPVLALTAGALGEERRRAEAAGMNDFLTKPLDPQGMVRALRRAVEAARGRPLELSPSAQPTELPIGWPHIDGIDGRDAAHRLGQDIDLFLRMLRRLLGEFGSAHFDREGAADDGLYREQLCTRLHKLRGSAGLLGASELHRLSGEAEIALRAGVALQDVQPGLAALEQALRNLERATSPVIESRKPQEAPTDIGALATTEANEEDVSQLLEMLRKQDLAASDAFRELAGGLLARWGNERVEQIRQAVEELEFTAAVQLIEQSQSQKRDSA
jgi:PAS domain S-box-containing protein